MLPNLKACKPANPTGFTLIEVLVAMAIFAALSIMAYQVVDQLHRSDQLTAQKEHRLSQLKRALVLLDGDFKQIATRAFRHEGETEGVLLLWQDYLLNSQTQGLLFTRLGWQNPLSQFPRSEVVKVGYRLNEGVLERLWWYYPDTPVAQKPNITPLLDGVEAWSLRFYHQGVWHTQWRNQRALPEAVALKLTLSDYGDVERIYLVASTALEVGNAPAE